jgi:hypothetical protein
MVVFDLVIMDAGVVFIKTSYNDHVIVHKVVAFVSYKFKKLVMWAPQHSA